MKDKERKLVVQEKVPIDVGRLPRAVEYSLQVFYAHILRGIRVNVPHSECHHAFCMDDDFVAGPFLISLIEADIRYHTTDKSSGERRLARVTDVSSEIGW